MRRALLLVLCAGVVAGSFATTSRILSMGKHDAFFMDETSVFRNPANTNIYPNMLMGSPGEYRILPEEQVTDENDYQALSRDNRDPRDPFFGAILTYSFDGGGQDQGKHPMLSVGAVFNRKDDLLKYLTSDTSIYGAEAALVEPLNPVGKVDLMVGYALPGGGKIGVGTYLAFNSEDKSQREAKLYKGSVGVNWPLGRSIDMEASAGFGLINMQDTIRSNDTIEIDGEDVIFEVGDDLLLGENDVALDFDLRLFSAMTAINGDFVPHVGVNWAQYKAGQRIRLDVEAGVGLNVNIDKGFFWAGLEGLYRQRDYLDTDYSSSSIGARVSFGVERNVVWDWFVVRVGCMKEILYVTEDNKQGYWAENAEHDADNDLVGMGIGLNVENRLKFDILVAEDVVYTLTNLFSGPQHHVFTRIDATLSF